MPLGILKFITVVLTVLMFTCAIQTRAVASHFWFRKTLSVEKTEKRWGSAVLDTSEFKNGKPEQRAKMSVSLIKNKKDWVGKPIEEIRKILGRPDGFYFTDTIPAYLIEVGKDKTQESWQIVFLPDRDFKVADLIIHRNCCD